MDVKLALIQLVAHNVIRIETHLIIVLAIPIMERILLMLIANNVHLVANLVVIQQCV